ncbi:Protein kinase, catalytic domain-containing protein [Cynara cardunculus var. scolymus]|uniref:Protein kinase, catalytic domain-containing protein n=1 Tax=Cynara cardunculus var. scolymus TaxID=59895 RepID=A0A103XC42_CYNCS|nr:Protein kinase, catalytic domain-containing protein [Cynara cardunculus var. scolymus]
MLKVQPSNKKWKRALHLNNAKGDTEVIFLGRLAHPNIIRLLGYCSDEQESLLVYEYMQNRSFDRLLFTNATSLSWLTRLMIMIGVARGLAYLHSSTPQVILRGFKTSDIMLDQDFNAKLGDFGLARRGPEIGETHVSTRVMGTYGYAAPEYITTGRLSARSDIYGFGVVLLETVTGLRAMDQNRPSEHHNLVEWKSPMLARRNKLKGIMDPCFGQNYPLEAASKYAKLTLKCLSMEPRLRPSSEEVLQSLEQIYSINK